MHVSAVEGFLSFRTSAKVERLLQTSRERFIANTSLYIGGIVVNRFASHLQRLGVDSHLWVHALLVPWGFISGHPSLLPQFTVIVPCNDLPPPPGCSQLVPCFSLAVGLMHYYHVFGFLLFRLELVSVYSTSLLPGFLFRSVLLDCEFLDCLINSVLGSPCCVEFSKHFFIISTFIA